MENELANLLRYRQSLNEQLHAAYAARNRTLVGRLNSELLKVEQAIQQLSSK